MWFWVIFIELVLLFAIGLLVRKAVRRYTTVGLFWALLSLAGFAVAGFSGANSTKPTSAPRITITGTAADCVEHRIGRSNYTYSFVFTPIIGVPIKMESRIKAPLCWQDNQSRLDGRVYRVQYLDAPDRRLKNEAIRIDVLQGKNAGWHGSVDARPFGLWLGAPFGIVLIVIGSIGAFKNRRLPVDNEYSELRDPHVLQKDTDSDLTSLKL